MKVVAIIMIASIFVFLSCSKDDGESFGPYYEFTFTDSVSAIVQGDTVHVTVYELPVGPQYLPSIPFEVKDGVGLADTVRLRLRVLYGGYSPTPSPNRKIQVGHDSLRLRYDRAATLTGLGKISNNDEVQTSPVMTFYSIQAVEIIRRPGRHATFVTINIR